jgi:hypothetical protein
MPARAARGPKPFDKRAAGNDCFPMNIRIQCLCVDSAHPSKSADFWEAALGWRRTHDSGDEVVLEPPAGSPEDGIVPDLLFLKVPEGKAVKNRLHLDLRPALRRSAHAGSTSGRATSAGW